MKPQCDVDVCHKRLYSAPSKNLHVEVVNIVHIRLMPAAFKATNFSTFNIRIFCLFAFLFMSKDSAEPVSVWVSYVLLTYSTLLYSALCECSWQIDLVLGPEAAPRLNIRFSFSSIKQVYSDWGPLANSRAKAESLRWLS